MNYSYIDTHAHLNLSAFKDDVDTVVNKCQEEEVSVVNIGTNYKTSQKAVALAKQYEHLYAMVGLHPIQTTQADHDEEELGAGGQPFISQGEKFNSELFRELALSSDKVVGVGECGFDYYHNEPDTYEIQEKAFIEQIELANDLQLPLMIHTRGPKPGQVSPTGRSVYRDVYEILKRYAKVPGNVHFYAGTYEEAKLFFALGFTISFTGVITFASDYEEVVKAAPLQYMHAETDCPFVAPVPYRGKRAEPWQVKEVYNKIALLKGEEEEAVRQQLLENAQKLYKLSI